MTNRGKNVIVISAHPDDEVLGAGGALIRHRESRDNVFWLIVTGMHADRGFTLERIQSRNQEIETIAHRLKIKDTFKLNYPTATLSSSSLIQLVPDISKVFLTVKPEVVYCLNRSDAHSDHRIIFQAAMACCKTFRYPFVKKILMYECISETEFAPALMENVFLPNYYIDISNYIEEKLELLKVYESEFSTHPFPRSIDNVKALAHFRGATAGVQYAEAFQLIKYIE